MDGEVEDSDEVVVVEEEEDDDFGSGVSGADSWDDERVGGGVSGSTCFSTLVRAIGEMTVGTMATGDIAIGDVAIWRVSTRIGEQAMELVMAGGSPTWTAIEECFGDGMIIWIGEHPIELVGRRGIGDVAASTWRSGENELSAVCS